MSKHPTSTDETTTADARDAHGRFAPGNRGGPGNPFARKTAALRQALLNTVTDQDIQEIAHRLIFDAKMGDKAAVKLLFQYVIGKPQPAVNPDTLDREELELMQSAALPAEAVQKFTGKVPPELAVDIFRAVAPEMTKHLTAAIAATVPPPNETPAVQPNEPSAEKCGGRRPSPNGTNGRTWPAAVAAPLLAAGEEPSANGDNGGFDMLSRVMQMFSPPEAGTKR